MIDTEKFLFQLMRRRNGVLKLCHQSIISTKCYLICNINPLQLSTTIELMDPSPRPTINDGGITILHHLFDTKYDMTNVSKVKRKKIYTYMHGTPKTYLFKYITVD